MVVYIVGLAGLLSESSRDFFLALTPVNLLFAYVVVFSFHRGFNLSFFLTALFIFALGMGAEIIGVKTGVVFGEYTYGETLGPAFMNVPWLIGLNWFFLVYCSVHLARCICPRGWAVVCISVGVLVIFDLALESPAIKMDMWQWGGRSYPPAQNFLAWAGLGAIMSSVFYLKNALHKNAMASRMLIIQFIFFVLLTIFL